MSLRLATVNENARSALDCGREAAAFSLFPSAHAPKTSKTKAVAAATAVQSAFGTAIFIAEAQRPPRKAPLLARVKITLPCLLTHRFFLRLVSVISVPPFGLSTHFLRFD